MAPYIIFHILWLSDRLHSTSFTGSSIVIGYNNTISGGRSIMYVANQNTREYEKCYSSDEPHSFNSLGSHSSHCYNLSDTIESGKLHSMLVCWKCTIYCKLHYLLCRIKFTEKQLNYYWLFYTHIMNIIIWNLWCCMNFVIWYYYKHLISSVLKNFETRKVWFVQSTSAWLSGAPPGLKRCWSPPSCIKYWILRNTILGGSMMNFQKLVGSGPGQPVLTCAISAEMFCPMNELQCVNDSISIKTSYNVIIRRSIRIQARRLNYSCTHIDAASHLRTTSDQPVRGHHHAQLQQSVWHRTALNPHWEIGNARYARQCLQLACLLLGRSFAPDEACRRRIRVRRYFCQYHPGVEYRARIVRRRRLRPPSHHTREPDVQIRRWHRPGRPSKPHR